MVSSLTVTRADSTGYSSASHGTTKEDIDPRYDSTAASFNEANSIRRESPRMPGGTVYHKNGAVKVRGPPPNVVRASKDDGGSRYKTNESETSKGSDEEEARMGKAPIKDPADRPVYTGTKAYRANETHSRTSS